MSGLLILLAVAAVFGLLVWVVIRSTKGPSAPTSAANSVFMTPTSTGAGNSAVSQGSPSSAGAFSSVTSTPAASGRSTNHQETTMSYQEIEGRATQAANRGRFDEAIELYNEALGVVHDSQGGDSTEIARLLILQGSAFQVRDRACSLEDVDCGEYLRALSIYEQRLGLYAEENLTAIDKLTSWYDQYGDTARSHVLFNRAARIRARRAAPNFDTGSLPVSPFDVTFACPDAQVNNLCRQGDEAFAAKDYEAGAKGLEDALEMAYEKLGENHECEALLFHRLGRLYQIKDAEYRDDNGKHFTDPADNFQKALAILTSIHGNSSRALIPVLLDLASFEDQRADHVKADMYLSRIETILSSTR